MISSLNDPAGVAHFLKTSTRLSKRLLGEYLAKPANSEVLKAFMQLFDFHGVSVYHMKLIKLVNVFLEFS